MVVLTLPTIRIRNLWLVEYDSHLKIVQSYLGIACVVGTRGSSEGRDSAGRGESAEAMPKARSCEYRWVLPFRKDQNERLVSRMFVTVP